MSASWFLCQCTWILGSRLILPNNQSKATLWVRDTCLIVGLLPLIIILITASVSSKIYSIAPNRENFAFDGTQSTLLFRSKLSWWVGTLVWLWVWLFHVVLRDKFPCTSDLWCCWVSFGKNGTLLWPQSKDQELGYRPCVNLHRE